MTIPNRNVHKISYALCTNWQANRRALCKSSIFNVGTLARQAPIANISIPRRVGQLIPPTTRYSDTHHCRRDVEPIRFHQDPQGGPIPFLPDQRGQRSHQVSDHPRTSTFPARHCDNPSSCAVVCCLGLCEKCLLKFDELTCGIPRSFLTRAYPIMKKNNPSIPIMLREAAGTTPKIYTRYGG